MKQSEKLMQLLELMRANPELPVIPCVDGDVVSGDEYYCWLGSWGESAVQEFVIGSERTYYREDDISEMNDVLCEHYDPELVMLAGRCAGAGMISGHLCRERRPRRAAEGSRPLPTMWKVRGWLWKSARAGHARPLRCGERLTGHC